MWLRNYVVGVPVSTDVEALKRRPERGLHCPGQMMLTKDAGRVSDETSPAAKWSLDLLITALWPLEPFSLSLCGLPLPQSQTLVHLCGHGSVGRGWVEFQRLFCLFQGCGDLQ